MGRFNRHKEDKIVRKCGQSFIYFRIGLYNYTFIRYDIMEENKKEW